MAERKTRPKSPTEEEKMSNKKTKKNEPERQPVGDMYHTAVYVRAIHTYWPRDTTDNYHYDTKECEAVVGGKLCTGILIGSDGVCPKCGTETDPPEGPMMNGRYPLPGFYVTDEAIRQAATKLVDLPVCLVLLEEDLEPALALTGGGMNLAWEICEAYMRLGYLPPFEFVCGLPRLASMKYDELHMWILDGAAKTAKTMAVDASDLSASVDTVRKWLQDK